MTRTRRLRLRLLLTLLGVVVALAGTLALFGHLLLAGVVVLIGGIAMLLVHHAVDSDPQSVDHWQAQERHVHDGLPIIYWRPASYRCWVVRWQIGRRADEVLWVDVWSDDAAAAFVRDVNEGVEVVPTMITRAGDAVPRPDREAVEAEIVTAGGSHDR